MQDEQWGVFWTKCRICSHKYVAVIPILDGETPEELECANCENMTCEIVDKSEYEEAI